MKPEPKRPSGGDPTPWFYRNVGAWLAPLERALGIDCRRFTRLASRRMDGPIGFRERVACRVHRLICALCREQDRRMRCLSDLIGRAARQQRFDPDAALSEEAKLRIRARLLDELTRGSGEG